MSQKSKEGREIGQKLRPFGAPGCVRGPRAPTDPPRPSPGPAPPLLPPSGPTQDSSFRSRIRSAHEGARLDAGTQGGQTVKHPSRMVFGSWLSGLGGWLVLVPCVPLNPQPSFCENWTAHQPGRQEATAPQAGHSSTPPGDGVLQTPGLQDGRSGPRAWALSRAGGGDGTWRHSQSRRSREKRGQREPHGCSQLVRELSPSTRG